MKKLESLEQANEITAVRLSEKRQIAKVGDLFRYSPQAGIYGWGRLIKRGGFFRMGFDLNLVYIYDAWGETKPSPELLTPRNLLIGPIIVNNLGWSRGYWQIVEREPPLSEDILKRHIFISFGGRGPKDFIYVDEAGDKVYWPSVIKDPLSQSGIANFNLVDWTVRGILTERGILKDPA